MTITAMEAYLQDLSKITFVDPAVGKFASLMASTIEANQAVVTTFANDVIARPFDAFENSHGVKLAAARLSVAREYLDVVLDYNQHSSDKTWACIGADVRTHLMDRVLYAAGHPTRSTNVETNEMERYKLRAQSEMLERLTKGRF